MSASSTPFGLRPVYHPSGHIRQESTIIASAYGTSIWKHAPVAIAADGTLTVAAAGGRACGVFMGCEYTPSDGRRRVSNFWPANQVATDIVAYHTRDPDIVYEIQANGSVAQLSVGAQFDWTANGTANGNATTGLSTVQLDTGAGGANAGLQVLGFAPYPDNAAGDAFTIVNVRISEHQFRADVAQF